MKINLYKKLVLLPALFLAMAAIQFSCSEDVDLPMPFLKADKSIIIASPGETTVDLLIESNWEWTLAIEGEGTSWLSVDATTAIGNQNIKLHINRNVNSTRSAVIKILSKKDNSIQTSVEIKQYSLSETGSIPIAGLRELASNITGAVTEYKIIEDLKIRGSVVTNILTANYAENFFAIQDGYNENSGITIGTKGSTWFDMGEEIQISLKDAILKKDANGVLQLYPEADSKISKTGATQTSPQPVEISYDELVSDKYESMYVGIPAVQVFNIVSNTIMEGSIEMQDIRDNRFIMYTHSTSAFATTNIPKGSGKLNGIATRASGDFAIKPCILTDFNLINIRLGVAAGIKLPYVFSLLAVGPGNADGMVYNTRTGTDNDPMNQRVFTNDGKGMTLTFHGLDGSGGDLRATYWIENSGHHNLPIKSWKSSDPHLLFTIPLSEDIKDKFRFSFGIASTGGGPQNWKVLYSTDGSSWKQSDNNEILSIPQGLNVGGQKNFFYFSTFITPNKTLTMGSSIYIKITPANNTSVNGGTVATGGEARLHSAIVIDKQPTEVTSFPSNKIYSEGFDRIFGGFDYLLGDKLSAMVAYSGKDISGWNDTQKAGLTGSNVRERVGYVQIGFSETQSVTPATLVNNVGTLTTPKFSALSGNKDVKLTFEAMAYKTMSLAASNAKDAGGDITTVYLEIIGGGTFDDNQTTKEFSGLNHSSFTEISANIKGATPNTQIRFTSNPQSGKFSRWFLDNICVTPK